MYPVEEILDEDNLFCRVHKNNIIEGTLAPVVFKERGGGESKGLSTDWEKYSTAEEAQNRARNPLQNGIIKFNAGELRNCELKLNVDHAPLYEINNLGEILIDNRAHSNIKGVDTHRERLIALDIFEWVIQPTS